MDIIFMDEIISLLREDWRDCFTLPPCNEYLRKHHPLSNMDAFFSEYWVRWFIDFGHSSCQQLFAYVYKLLSLKYLVRVVLWSLSLTNHLRDSHRETIIKFLEQSYSTLSFLKSSPLFFHQVSTYLWMQQIWSYIFLCDYSLYFYIIIKQNLHNGAKMVLFIVYVLSTFYVHMKFKMT